MEYQGYKTRIFGGPENGEWRAWVERERAMQTGWVRFFKVCEMFYTMQWQMHTVKILSLRYVLYCAIADVHYECNIINK